MKSISITFNADNLIIPLGYHHYVQSLIYALLLKGGGVSFHDESFTFGQRKYKLFTFSSLRGGKIIPDKKKLSFDKYMYLDVRSIRDDFCDTLIKGLNTKDVLRLCENPLTVEDIKISQPQISNSNLNIKMLSPVTLHKTNDSGQSIFISPYDTDFSTELNNNFARKYYSFTGEEPITDVLITPTNITPNNKYVTCYKKAINPNEKDIYITGYRGEYNLVGDPDYLNFLYYCGLGARNSDGFGMFQIM